MSAADSDFVLVGRICRPHGVRGEVSVEVESDVPERFAPGSPLTLCDAAGRRPIEVATVRRHHGRLLVGFSGVSDRESAALLRGAVLEVSCDLTPPAEPGSYYHFELVGCRCSDRASGELGRVVDVIEDGGGVLLEVSDGQRALLVPFVRSFLVAVDRQASSIEFDLPPGLLETCTSPS